MTPISLTYYSGDGVQLTGVEASLYGRNDVVRQATRAGIRRFVNEHRELLSGRVLDYGCGKAGTCAIPQPYRSLIAASEHFGWEPGDGDPIHQAPYDAILCTQTLQNVDDPAELCRDFGAWLKPGGALVMTYPVAWEEIEQERWRFTRHGVWALLHNNFRIVAHECLVRVVLDGALNLAIVNGVCAVKS
jgi:SAM-dependent methyltransferase